MYFLRTNQPISVRVSIADPLYADPCSVFIVSVQTTFWRKTVNWRLFYGLAQYEGFARDVLRIQKYILENLDKTKYSAE